MKMMRMVLTDVCSVHGAVRTVVVVVGLCVVVGVGVVMGEPFYQRRDHLDQDRYLPARHNSNVVRNHNDAAFILSKYGYLRCRIQRRRRDAERRPGARHPAHLQAERDAVHGENLHPSGDSRWTGNFLLSEEGGTRVCNDSEVQQAIRKYQRTYNLAPTGVLDQETKQLMSALRCGNADTEGALLLQSEKDGSKASAKKSQHPASPVKDSRDVKISAVSLPSSESSSSSSRSSSSSDPVVVNGVGDAQRLWKRAINKIRSDDPSRLLRVLKGASKSKKQSRHLRHLQKYIAQLSHKPDADVLLRPWSEEEHLRAKRSIQVTASGNQEQAMNLDELEVSEHRPGLAMEADPGVMFNKELIRWRLLSTGYSTRIPVEDQRATLDLAFRMWSEVIPLRFVEDSDSDISQVDIEIAFGRGSHQNCEQDFDGTGGEIAHSQHAGDMHFDDEENFKSIHSYTPDGIYLLRVAVHEIGHVLGLAHTNRSQSIMYAIYHGSELSPEFELSREDRQMVQRIYGVCKGSFSTVFDWVRRRPDSQYIYNTYFFRGDHYWMYENHANRTRYGDPLYIAREWEGVPNHVDAYLHTWFFSGNEIVDQAFFFKGEHYYKYNSDNDTVYEGWPRLIQDDFGPKPGQSVSIPNNLDSVFFDMRDKNIYFFKDDMVYVYNPQEPEETRGCCERIRSIEEEFPSAVDNNVTLEGHLDAVYYSYADRMQYFFKGENFWRNRLFDPRQRRVVNSVEFIGNWYDLWMDICDVQPH